MSTESDSHPSPTPVEGAWILDFRAGERQAETYDAIELRIRTSEGEFQAEILSRVLSRKEFFFCVVTTCNTHWGFDPSRLYLADGPTFEDLSKCSGDPLLFHGHAYPSSRHMSEAAHRFNLPMTWLIDHTVAKEHGRELIEFHKQFGDDIDVLPSSYVFDNCDNYRLTYSRTYY